MWKKVHCSPLVTERLVEHTAVGRQVEDKNCEESDCNARNDEVDGVEESLAPDGDIERDVWIWLRTARVVFLVLDGWNAQKVPLNTRVEVLELDPDFQGFQIADTRFLNDVFQVDL